MAQKVLAEKNISLKALVDKGSKRVIIGEADNDFIDVLFSFLTIPTGKIVRLAWDHSTPLEIGCMNKLYQSIEKLDVQVFRSNACRDMLLLPHTAANCHCKNLKLKIIDDAEPTRFKCANIYASSQSYWLSYYSTVPCPSCSNAMNSEVYFPSWGDSQVGGVFAKERARVIITDDFQVIPPFSAASISLFTKLGAMNSNTTEELTFSIGVEQMLDSHWKGCIDQLCKGVLDVDEQFFKSNFHKELPCNPKLVPGFSYENNLLGIEEVVYHKFSDRKFTADRSIIPSMSLKALKVKFLDPKSHGDKDRNARGFLKEKAIFTVTDNLDVRPVYPIFQPSVLNDLKVHFTDIEDRTVHVGKKEALHLLVASFVSDFVLTNAFLRKPKEQAIKQEN
ncbi:hypothetical protein RchiOBHm_Chr5g0067571 [Rosa chinensis]|uniref:DUF674 family protein n=1 Tax=Rosa chinensis TaxID=74649 RepID=A0A2P6QJH3_ROSCH|nr:hypothetical protein RchiOBHm_Chr5g0067571 [Rosa chinensis]